MKLSVITINYNNLGGLKKTIQSVIDQDYDNIEYIVIDGGSSDGSSDFLESKNEHFDYWISEKDTGIYNAMNKGIRIATGEFLLFLNSGDYLREEVIITKAVNHFKGNADIIYGDLIIDMDPEQKLITFPDKLDFSFFYHKGYLPHPSTFIRRRLFNDLSMYSENLKIASDWEFMVCAICKYNIPYSHMNLAISVYDNQGISSNPEHRQLLLNEKSYILNKHFSAHLDDTKKLLYYKETMSTREFQRLESLLKGRFSRKVMKFVLKISALIFGK